jgi:DeoR family fructose operon transcriptional repressor
VRRPRPQTTERHAALLREVAAGNGDIHDLAERFGVSESTIRRDLAALQRLGQITRTYGGAVEPAERPLREKERGHRKQKDAIARAAAALIEDGDMVVLDAGTTTGRLAWHLRDRAGLTVVVVGVNALSVLAEAPGIDLIVLGGRIRHPNEGVVGPFAEEQLRWLRPDMVFIGTDGLTARGLCCPSLEQARLKHAMLRCGRRACVLTDSSKLGSEPFAYWAPLDRDHTVIIDDGAGPGELDPLRSVPGCHISVVTV